MKNFTKKFGREDQNPGGCNNPPLVANVSRNSLVVRGLKHPDEIWSGHEFNNIILWASRKFVISQLLAQFSLTRFSGARICSALLITASSQ